MDMKDFKLIICRQDHDDSLKGTSVESAEITLDNNSLTDDNRVPDHEIMNLVKNENCELSIYEKKNVSDDVSWIFLKSNDTNKNYFCHVISMMSKQKNSN